MMDELDRLAAQRQRVFLRVVCSSPNAFHDRYGRSNVETFERVEAERAFWIASPFADLPEVRSRPQPTTYLRGNVIDEEGRVYFAITHGTRETSRGSFPAEAEDLAGRVQVELRCKCSPSLRVRGERLWPIFDALVDGGAARVELDRLRRLLRSRRVGLD